MRHGPARIRWPAAVFRIAPMKNQNAWHRNRCCADLLVEIEVVLAILFPVLVVLFQFAMNCFFTRN
jgi:hypothetical protein